MILLDEALICDQYVNIHTYLHAMSVGETFKASF